MDELAEKAVRIELVRRRDEARRMMRRGVTWIASVPVAVLASLLVSFALEGFAAMIAVLFAVTYTIVGGIAGIASITGGVADHRHTTRQLRALDEAKQLPAARLVVR